jgi:hypothetical protein
MEHISQPAQARRYNRDLAEYLLARSRPVRRSIGITFGSNCTLNGV